MSVPHRDSVYDNLRPYLTAEDLVARLPLRHVRTSGNEIYCEPLCHQSGSGESLQVNRTTGRWNCKACQHEGFAGDLFSLAEYALSGGQRPAVGAGKLDQPRHREAIEWLCGQYGVPFSRNQPRSDPALDVLHLFAMAGHQHLLDHAPEVLAWIEGKWGFDRSTVESYGIGYIPPEGIPAILAEAARPENRKAFQSSGLGWYPQAGPWQTNFSGRITFPYLESGRAVYLIGRSTPWTQGPAAKAKYYKLPVHSESKPWISPSITNDHLWGEPNLAGGGEVGVVEGVADAVAASALGARVVSPVTISFNSVDLERFSSKAIEAGVRQVWVLFDNELSGSGNFAARKTARQLVERGLQASVAQLPLGEAQEAARHEVEETIGSEAFVALEAADPRLRKEILEDACDGDDERFAWAVQNLQASKVDVAEWAAEHGAGASKAFQGIIERAKDVISIEIAAAGEAARASQVDDPVRRFAHFRDAIRLVAGLSDRMLREGYAGAIAEEAGRGVSKAAVKSEVSDARREAKARHTAARAASEASERQEPIVLPPVAPIEAHTQPPAPSVDESVPAELRAPSLHDETLSEWDHLRPAREAVSRLIEKRVDEWVVAQYCGEQLIRTLGYTVFSFADDLWLVRANERIQVVTMGSSKAGARFRDLASTLGLVSNKSSHRPYLEVLGYELSRHAKKVPSLNWCHIEHGTEEIYVPTGTDGRLVKMQADGSLDLVRMADCKVPAVIGPEFAPVRYVDGDGISAALEAFRWTSLPDLQRRFLVYWIATMPLVRWIGTCPIVRIEGGSSSGKTRVLNAASRLVRSNLVVNSSSGTSASLTSRLSREMISFDDNLESDRITPQMARTLLQVTQLGTLEKRAANTDTGVVSERICGGLITNGVEPIHAGKSELISRMVVLRADAARRGLDGAPSEDDALWRRIEVLRDSFWSEAFRRCAASIPLNRQYGPSLGDQIEGAFGKSRIGRTSAFLRRVYLLWVLGEPEALRPDLLARLDPTWTEFFRDGGDAAMKSLATEELSVAAVRLVFAFGASIAEGAPNYKQAFNRDKYLLTDSYERLGDIGTSQLCRLAREAAQELNGPEAIRFQLNVGQLEARLLDGLDFIRAAGFEVEHYVATSGKHRWVFQRPVGHRGTGQRDTSTASDDGLDLPGWV